MLRALAAGRRAARRDARVESPLGRSRASSRRARAPHRAGRSPSRSRPRRVEALDIAWRTLAAHRRRRIDFSARRRHEGGSALVIPFESGTLNAHDLSRHCSPRAACSSPFRRAPAAQQSAAGIEHDRADQHERHRREPASLHRRASRSSRATPSSTPTRSRSTSTRIAPSPPATWCSARATTGSPPTAPSSTPRRGSGRSTTPAASPTSSRRARRVGRRRRAPPPMTGQETDVYFFGETVEKIGPRKYKITNGGFTHLRAADAALGLAAPTPSC